MTRNARRHDPKQRLDARRRFDAAATLLTMAIDIAIESCDYREAASVDQPDYRRSILDDILHRLHSLPEERRTMQALGHLKRDLLRYYEWSSGSDVDYFWRKIEEEGIGYAPVDHVGKILERGFIANNVEYLRVDGFIRDRRTNGKLADVRVHALERLLDMYHRTRLQDKKR